MRFLERQVPRTNKHHSYSEDDWNALLDRARDWSRNATAADERFYIKDMLSGLGIGQKTVRRVIEHLMAEGTIVYRGSQKLGYAALGVATSVTNLDSLHRLAKEHMDKRYTPSKGPRRSRRVERISENQLKDIETLVNLVTRHVGDGDPRAVGPEHFAWDPSAGRGGEGDWTLVERIGSWSNEEHRARCLSQGKKWSPKQNHMRGKMESSARTLLDLAATVGMIPKGQVHTTAHSLHAAEWQPTVDRWVEEILRRTKSKNDQVIVRGCRMLALRATRRGEVGAENVDWKAVRDQIEGEVASGELKYRPFADARWVFNKLREYSLIDAPKWSTKQQQRRSLVTMEVVRYSAKTRDFSGWVTGAGTPATALANGPYGIHGWVSWCRAKDDRELRATNLPPRVWPNPTPEEQRRVLRAKKNQTELFKLSASVMETRLHHVAYVAGWAEKKEGIDWNKEGLDRMVDPSLLEQMVRDLHPSEGAVDEDGDPVTSLGSQIAFTLATMASPYLEAQALAEGEHDLAQKMRHHSDDLKVLGIRLQAEKKKETQAIIKAWDAGSGKGGWARLWDLREEMIRAIIDAAGGLSLEEQAVAIETDDFQPHMTWAVLVRDACVVSFLRTVPVRVRTLVGMKLGMWINEGSSDRKENTDLWEGGIRLRFSRQLMKSRRSFQPTLFRVDHVGDKEREADFCRPLWRLYFMSGGAREEVLRYTPENGQPTVANSDFVFPALARRGGGHGTDHDKRKLSGLRWKEGSASSQFSRRVLQFAPRLGMSVAALNELWGSTSIHVIRLLYGTHWANRPGMLKPASLMLHHANSKITENKYCVPDEGSVDLFEPVDPPNEADMLREEIRRLRAKLEEAGCLEDESIREAEEIDLVP